LNLKTVANTGQSPILRRVASEFLVTEVGG
jgi:hypothetical protein